MSSDGPQRKVEMDELTFDSLKPKPKPKPKPATPEKEVRSDTDKERESRMPMVVERSAKDEPMYEWEQGICGCFETPSITLGVICCNLCTIGQSASIALGGRKNVCIAVTVVLLLLSITSSVLQNVQDAAAMIVAAILSVLITIVGVATVFAARNALRERENLEGSAAMDLFYAICCTSCAACTILRQVGSYRGPFATYSKLDDANDDAQGAPERYV